MTDSPILRESLAIRFSQMAQYISSLTAQVDLWREIPEALILYFDIEFAGIGHASDSGGMNWILTYADEEVWDEQKLRAAAEGVAQDVLRTGFLAEEQFTEINDIHILCLPIEERRRTSRVMVLGFARELAPSREQLELYLGLACFVGNTAARLHGELQLRQARDKLEVQVQERTELLAEEKRRTEHLNRILLAVRNVGEVITRRNRTDDLIQSVCDEIVRTLEHRGAWIILMDSCGTAIGVAAAGLGEGAQEFRDLVGKGRFPACVGEALRTGQFVAYRSSSAACADCPAHGGHSADGGVTLSVKHADTVYGLLGISLSADVPEDPEELSLLRQMADHIGLGISRIYSEQQRQLMAVRMTEKRRLESIGTLAGGVAHEINNPINGIMNYAQLIKDSIEDHDETLSAFAADIIEETERVATIVRSLLRFARQDETGTMRRVQPDDIIDSTLSLLRAIIRHDQIALRVDLPENLPEICCNRQQIEHVLMNLVTNARDALNERFPEHVADKVMTIRVRRRLVRKRPFMRFTVEDRGGMLSPELAARIFEPFYTTKSRSRSDSQPYGTGLGLSLSLGIAREHGGDLCAESDPGQWTRFHLDLPVAGYEE